MFLILNEELEATDASVAVGTGQLEDRKTVKIPAGRYEMGKIKNPFGFEGLNTPWLVFKNTIIGCAEIFLRNGGIHQDISRVCIED